MTTICVIPARGGSQRIPRKNIKNFAGRPIIEYSIEAAKQSGLFDKIYVSTDDDEIGDIAMNAGARYWKRKPSFAMDCVGTQEVVRECLEGVRSRSTDIVCCIYATAPLMDVNDLILGHTQLVLDETATFVMSVGYPPLQDAAQFYWGLSGSFKAEVPLISNRTRMIHIPEERVCDINTHWDWNVALVKYQELKK